MSDTPNNTNSTAPPADAPSTAVTTQPAPPAAPPPPPAAPTPRQLAKERNLAQAMRRFDALHVLLLVAFAFLVSSFAVRNSDFFLNLAVGRDVLAGNYTFGSDPYSFGTEGAYWANHSWLFGVIVYLLHSLGSVSGYVLVGGKAVMIAALAGMMLRVAWQPGRSVWVPALCVFLAVVVLSPRLFLQPVFVSFVFLGLTLLLLRWPRWQEKPTFTSFWLLPPLFALWVNLDAWFLLGPVTVALYALAEFAQAKVQPGGSGDETPRPREPEMLLYALAAGLVACFLSPHHVHAFTLPYQLGFSPAAEVVRDDNTFKAVFCSPFNFDTYTLPQVGGSVAGYAYYALAALGLVSFGLNWKEPRYWRVTLWAAFFLLSAYNARCIPFFAVVAGPIMSLNFLDFARRTFAAQAKAEEVLKRVGLYVRALTAVVGVLAVVATLPGWLQAAPYDQRRVSWRVVPEPGLKDAAEQVARWRQEDKVPAGGRWFNTSPGFLDYLAWYAPGEKAFFDQRLNIYPAQAAEDWLSVRQDVLPKQSAEGAKPPAEPSWRRVFPQHRARLLVVNENNPYRTAQALGLLRRGDEWTRVYSNGRVLVLGWHDPAGPADPAAFSAITAPVARQAFGADAEPSPPSRPLPWLERREWYAALLEPEPVRELDTDRAIVALQEHELRVGMWRAEDQRLLAERVNRELLGYVAAGGGPLALFVRVPNRPLLDQAPELPGLLLLAVRDCQRALAANPNDGMAYVALGQAYFKLYWETEENTRAQDAGFPHLMILRQTQLEGALTQAARLSPEAELAAHTILADHYAQSGRFQVPHFFSPGLRVNYRDQEVKHRREQLRLLKARGPSKEAEELEKHLKELQDALKRADDEYLVRAAGKGPLEQAELALQYGLADTALSVLQQAPPEQLERRQGPAKYPLGLVMEMKLLLSLGRLDEAKDRMKAAREEDKLSGVLLPEVGLPAFGWFTFLLGAGLGEYEHAEDTLDGLLELERGDPNRARGALEFSLLVGRFALLASPRPFGVHVWDPVTSHADLSGQLGAHALAFVTREADLHLLRGWIALERGDIPRARKELEAVRMTDPWGGPVGVRTRPLAEVALRWLDAAK